MRGVGIVALFFGVDRGIGGGPFENLVVLGAVADVVGHDHHSVGFENGGDSLAFSQDDAHGVEEDVLAVDCFFAVEAEGFAPFCG
jgi:hypothetical protein